MRTTLIVVLFPLLASCASWGLYNMSDDWCSAHVDASAARCPQNDEQRRVAANNAANDGKQVPKNEVATSE
ncbi:MAG TPA: hypothetical protein VI653_22680 [Steroidobacteraceae bacterium]